MGLRGALRLLVLGLAAAAVGEAAAQPVVPLQAAPVAAPRRVILARAAAIEQPIVYNRFGSFDPAGTI